MSSRYLTPGALVGHVLVLAAALTCLRLGWWQWEVFEAAGGTGQNLGYSLLWPVFAGSFIYMWLRFLQLEAQRDDELGQEDAPGADGYDGTRGAAGEVTADGWDGAAPASATDSVELSPDRLTPRRRSQPSAGHPTGHEVYTVGVGYIGDDDDEDPELAAYNRALAQLAEQDEFRAD